jgi:hypothetical protein
MSRFSILSQSICISFHFNWIWIKLIKSELNWIELISMQFNLHAMPFNIFHLKWTLIFTLKSIHLFSLIDQVMMTYYMQGHESQVNRLRNSYFDKNSKVKPTLSCEYYWDGWHYRRYNVHGPRATSQDEIQSFLQLKDFPNFQACALGLPPEATTLKLEGARGSWPSCITYLDQITIAANWPLQPLQYNCSYHWFDLWCNTAYFGCLDHAEVHTRPPQILNTEWWRVFWMTIKCIWENLNILIGTFQLEYKVQSNSENKIEQWAALLAPIHSCVSLIAFASIWLKVVYVHNM